MNCFLSSYLGESYADAMSCALLLVPGALLCVPLYKTESVTLTSCRVSYRVEPLATSGPLRSVWDTLSSSASQPARHPSGNTVSSVILQHLQMGEKEALTYTAGLIYRRKEVFKSSRTHHVSQSSAQKTLLKGTMKVQFFCSYRPFSE